jgi:hypothetical protein
MALPVADRRADSYRRRAQELAEAARAEDAKARRRFLIDKARSYWAVAEQIEPLLPAERVVARLRASAAWKAGPKSLWQYARMLLIQVNCAQSLKPTSWPPCTKF